MKFPDNITAILHMKPDFMGFIFYKKSLRYVDKLASFDNLSFPDEIAKVGVFVSATQTEILEKVNLLSLDFVQLHGNESAAFVQELHAQKIKIIKAFQIDEAFDWKKLKEYQKWVDYFLFDTPTEGFGGSGRKFNWDILKKYQESTPFFLSGGIGIDDIQEIKKLNFPLLCGIDVNSKFEIEPGRKDEKQVRKMINQVRNGSKL